MAPLIYVPLRAYVGHGGIYLCAGGVILAGLFIWAALGRSARPAYFSMEGNLR